jgi:hypothetical protein
MFRELCCASLCLLLAFPLVAGAGDGAPASASSTAPITPPAAVPELPGPGPLTPLPPRSTPPPGAPEGPGSVAAEQAAAIEENPD